LKDTIIKAIVYRLIIVISQALFIYAVTGSIKFATGISLAFAVLATGIHIIFERLWV